MDEEPRSANRILVVTGPPGAGKSTVAPLVAARLGPKSVGIEADWFWTTIRSGFVAPGNVTPTTRTWPSSPPS